MHELAFGVAGLVAVAILGIGIGYALRPLAMMGSFGLPLPEAGPVMGWWLRLLGVRDIGLGLGVLALAAWGSSAAVGLVLLAMALVPVGDMVVVLAGGGRVRTALGVHGATAVVMLLAGGGLLA